MGATNTGSTQATLSESLLGDESAEPQLPFYKKIKFLNQNESEFAHFKALSYQEGLLTEVGMMLAANKPPQIVYSGFKIATFFVRPTELPILLRELDSMTIFSGLKERAQTKFKAKHDSTVSA